MKLATGIPRIMDVYTTGTDTDTGARCVRVRAERDDDDAFLWDVTADYESVTADPDRTAENPLERATRISFSFTKSQVPILREPGTGRPIRNSAGEAFDPPVVMDESRPVVAFDKWQASFDPATALLYQNAVNSDVFFGGQPGQWKMIDMSAQPDFSDGLALWQVRYQIEGKGDGWQPLVLDQGFHYLDAGSGELFPFQDTQGRLSSSPQLLDGNGGPLADAASTLELAIDAVSTHLSLASIAPFPNEFPFVVRVGNELMLVTAEDADPADTWTVVRGYAGTTAAAHAAAAACTLDVYWFQFKVYRELPFGVLNLP